MLVLPSAESAQPEKKKEKRRQQYQHSPNTETIICNLRSQTYRFQCTSYVYSSVQFHSYIDGGSGKVEVHPTRLCQSIVPLNHRFIIHYHRPRILLVKAGAYYVSVEKRSSRFKFTTVKNWILENMLAKKGYPAGPGWTQHFQLVQLYYFYLLLFFSSTTLLVLDE